MIDGVRSYGANGFHLDFSDPDDLGADRSGNGNDFTASGGHKLYSYYTLQQADWRQLSALIPRMKAVC